MSTYYKISLVYKHKDPDTLLVNSGRSGKSSCTIVHTAATLAVINSIYLKIITYSVCTLLSLWLWLIDTIRSLMLSMFYIDTHEDTTYLVPLHKRTISKIDFCNSKNWKDDSTTDKNTNTQKL